MIVRLIYCDVATYGSDIFEAASRNDCVTVERLLQSGVPVDITDWVISKVPEYGMHYITVVSIGILVYIYI